MLLHRSSRYDGLQIVPQSLVPVVRGVFASQGIGPGAVSDTGELDPQALIALAYDKIELRTAYTPTLVMDLKAPPDPETARLLNDIRPHITFVGRAGRYELAPYGIEVPDSGGWSNVTKLLIGVGAGVIGLAVLSKAVL
jgi:hypothetical protein